MTPVQRARLVVALGLVNLVLAAMALGVGTLGLPTELPGSTDGAALPSPTAGETGGPGPTPQGTPDAAESPATPTTRPTGPVPTAPAATEPPASQPPATEPPATEPPGLPSPTPPIVAVGPTPTPPAPVATPVPSTPAPTRAPASAGPATPAPATPAPTPRPTTVVGGPAPSTPAPTRAPAPTPRPTPQPDPAVTGAKPPKALPPCPGGTTGAPGHTKVVGPKERPCRPSEVPAGGRSGKSTEARGRDGGAIIVLPYAVAALLASRRPTVRRLVTVRDRLRRRASGR